MTLLEHACATDNADVKRLFEKDAQYHIYSITVKKVQFTVLYLFQLVSASKGVQVANSSLLRQQQKASSFQ